MIPRLRDARLSGGYQRWERRTDVPLLVLALLFLVVLALPIVADLSPGQQAAVTVVNVSIWAVFVVDYLARLYLALRRWEFVRTHVLDLLVIALPMLRPMRALRLLRLARLGTFAGMLHQRGQRSLHARVGAYVAVSVVVALGLASVAMVDAERGAENANIKSLPDAMWWAVTTVTTVGVRGPLPHDHNGAADRGRTHGDWDRVAGCRDGDDCGLVRRPDAQGAGGRGAHGGNAGRRADRAA